MIGGTELAKDGFPIVGDFGSGSSIANDVVGGGDGDGDGEMSSRCCCRAAKASASALAAAFAAAAFDLADGLPPLPRFLPGGILINQRPSKSLSKAFPPMPSMKMLPTQAKFSGYAFFA